MTNDTLTMNVERTTKLRRNSLDRFARRQGLQLRHSDHGYSLIHPLNDVDGLRHVTLDEVAQYLERRADVRGVAS
jgi:hypothetical protein